MIKEKEYLDALKVVKQYEKQQSNKKSNTTAIYIKEDCPDGYWYTDRQETLFFVKTCCHSDLNDVEGFGGKDPNDFYKVTVGDFEGYVIDKKHCK